MTLQTSKQTTKMERFEKLSILVVQEEYLRHQTILQFQEKFHEKFPKKVRGHDNIFEVLIK